MPRSTIANRRARPFDKDLQLRDYAAAAISATTAGTAIEFAVTKMMNYTCQVTVAAYTGYTAGTATWEIAIEASTAQGGTYVEVGKCSPVGVNASFDIPLSGAWIQDKVADAQWVRVRAIKTGSPGNLTYGAYLTT
jgi:hypothetical protein